MSKPAQYRSTEYEEEEEEEETELADKIEEIMVKVGNLVDERIKDGTADVYKKKVEAVSVLAGAANDLREVGTILNTLLEVVTVLPNRELDKMMCEIGFSDIFPDIAEKIAKSAEAIASMTAIWKKKLEPEAKPPTSTSAMGGRRPGLL